MSFAVSTCVYTDPAPLDAYFASAASFWDEYGYLCDFADGMDDLLATKRALRKIHKQFLKLPARVRLQLAKRTMRVLDIRNPFPLLDDRRVAFDLEGIYVRSFVSAFPDFMIASTGAHRSVQAYFNRDIGAVVGMRRDHRPSPQQVPRHALQYQVSRAILQAYVSSVLPCICRSDISPVRGALDLGNRIVRGGGEDRGA